VLRAHDHEGVLLAASEPSLTATAAGCVAYALNLWGLFIMSDIPTRSCILLLSVNPRRRSPEAQPTRKTAPSSVLQPRLPPAQRPPPSITTIAELAHTPWPVQCLAQVGQCNERIVHPATSRPRSTLFLSEQNCDGIAEVKPEHKHGVVRALQRAGFVVGMTGDGVNDAPALAQAQWVVDVEITMKFS